MTAGSINWNSHCWNQFWRLLKKLKIEQSTDHTILLLDICLENSACDGDICTSMFTEALLTIAGDWNQSSCPSVDEVVVKSGTYMKQDVIQL